MIGLCRWKCTMQATSDLVAFWNRACRIFLQSSTQSRRSHTQESPHHVNPAQVSSQSWSPSLSSTLPVLIIDAYLVHAYISQGARPSLLLTPREPFRSSGPALSSHCVHECAHLYSDVQLVCCRVPSFHLLCPIHCA